MKESPVQEALRRIQELVASSVGAPLQGDAALKLHSLLAGLGERAETPHEGGNFKSREVTILLADLRGVTTVAARQTGGVAGAGAGPA